MVSGKFKKKVPEKAPKKALLLYLLFMGFGWAFYPMTIFCPYITLSICHIVRELENLQFLIKLGTKIKLEEILYESF